MNGPICRQETEWSRVGPTAGRSQEQDECEYQDSASRTKFFWLHQDSKITHQDFFKYCNFESTKVVIFGQDPYFQSGIANGLAFSVDEDQIIPASLKNIYKEIKDDIGPSKNKSGCLKSWAKQGVLLLNTALTVEVSKPGSHSNIGWDNFIYDIIKLINNKPNVVFILWGNHAQKYIRYLNNKNHLILYGPHPSPLSAYRGFFGSKHFSKCNNYLRSNNLKEIDW